MKDLKVTSDHNEIRKWARKYEGVPQIVDTAEGEKVRISFPGFIEDSHIPESRVKDVSWEAFFNKFDEFDLIFAYVERISLDDPEHVFTAYRLIKKSDWDDDRELMGEFLSENLTKEFMDYKERGRPD